MEQVIVQLAAAVNMRTLYPANHPRVIQTIEQVVDGVARVAAERHSDSITFLIVGDDLVVEQDVVRRTTLSQQQFVEILKHAAACGSLCHLVFGSGFAGSDQRDDDRFVLL